jgi:GAF domain-containing protein
VIPLIKNGKKWGVLDLDSPNLSRFSEEDSLMMEKIVHSFSEKIF